MVGAGLLGRTTALALALAAVLPLSAFQAGAAVPTGAAEPASSMTDLAGETCRLGPRPDIAPDPDAPAPSYVYCGKAERPSGTVSAVVMPLALPAAPAARHAIIEKAADAAPAGRNAAARMSCHTGKWTETTDKLDVLVKACTLFDGSWPQIRVIAGVGRYLVQADGLPAMLPALESAIAQTADYRPAGGAVPFGGPDTARDLLALAFGAKPAMVGGGDLDRFASLAETARLQNSREDFSAAEDAYRQALLIEERALGRDAPGVGTILMDLALEVSNQGRGEEAAALFRRADPIIQKSPNPADQARFFTYMAYDAANGGRFGDALNYAREATSIWRQQIAGDAPSFDDLGGGNEARSARRGELAHSLTAQAAMALRVDQLAEAEASAKEALEIIGVEPGLPPWWRPELLSTMGQIYARMERLDAAEQSFRGALIFQQRMFGDTAPTAMTLLALGGVYSAEGFFGDAVRAYKAAMDILAKDHLARSGILFDRIAPLLAAANGLAERHPEQRAELDRMMFRAVQMTAASVADQTIAQASIRLAADNPAIEKLVRGMQEAERKRDAARIELAQQTALPDEQRGSDKENALLVEINLQSGLRDAFLQQIRRDFPAYASLSDAGAVELDQLQSRLGPKEAVVMFEIGRERAYAVVVTGGRFLTRPLDIDQARLDEAVRGLRRAFTVRSDGRLGEFDLQDAFDLYHALFSPIADALAGTDQLIVVPGGALASLPVGLLVTQPPAGRDYRQAAWLVRRYATSQVPSVRALVELRDRAGRPHAGQPFLGIGDPTFAGSPQPSRGKSGLEALGAQCRDGGPIPPQLLKALPPLPETAGELRTVARALGAGPESLMLGGEATEAALRHRRLDDVRVLYFATHGLLPGELSCRSEPGLALSPPAAPAASKDEDGLLEASEIAGLRLNADLVVLSACNTAQGTGQLGGEALSGLADAFFYAGARTLVASHWQVPSSATASLMIGLFQRLGADLSGGIAESLRRSQLTLIEQEATAHPFFWAAFTVIGDGSGGPATRTADGPKTGGKL